MQSLRTPETEGAYRAYRETDEFQHGCRLCEAPALRQFELWKIVENKFPYDRIAKGHNMLVPLRHTRDDEFTEEERAEFENIRRSIRGEYDFFMEASDRIKTIPAHFHLHLLELLD